MYRDGVDNVEGSGFFRVELAHIDFMSMRKCKPNSGATRSPELEEVLEKCPKLHYLPSIVEDHLMEVLMEPPRSFPPAGHQQKNSLWRPMMKWT